MKMPDAVKLLKNWNFHAYSIADVFHGLGGMFDWWRWADWRLS